MAVTREHATVLYNEVKNALTQFSEDIWGYQALSDDGVIFPSSELTPEKRRDILCVLPSFGAVYFLSGITKEDYNADRGLIQRVLLYGGTLPGWKWAHGAGAWKEDFRDCFTPQHAESAQGEIHEIHIVSERQQ